jgi:hypothetical protein
MKSLIRDSITAGVLSRSEDSDADPWFDHIHACGISKHRAGIWRGLIIDFSLALFFIAAFQLVMGLICFGWW